MSCEKTTEHTEHTDKNQKPKNLETRFFLQHKGIAHSLVPCLPCVPWFLDSQLLAQLSMNTIAADLRSSNGNGVARTTGLGRFAPLASLGVVGALVAVLMIQQQQSNGLTVELLDSLRQQQKDVRIDHRLRDEQLTRALNENTQAIQELTRALKRDKSCPELELAPGP